MPIEPEGGDVAARRPALPWERPFLHELAASPEGGRDPLLMIDLTWALAGVAREPLGAGEEAGWGTPAVRRHGSPAGGRGADRLQDVPAAAQQGVGGAPVLGDSFSVGGAARGLGLPAGHPLTPVD